MVLLNDYYGGFILEKDIKIDGKLSDGSLVTISGSNLSSSVAVISEGVRAEFHNVNVDAGTGTYLIDGYYGGSFLVIGGSLVISGEGTYTGP